MLILRVILVHLVIVWLTVAEFIYGNFFEYTRNLTAVYKDPGHVYGEDLMRTAVFYLDELMELEEALEDKDEENKALKMLSDLYYSGGPKHIQQIPYDRFIDTYNWTSSELDDFAKYIHKTTESWERLLKILKKYLKSGKHPANNASDPLPRR